jgi:hypothetical protein
METVRPAEFLHSRLSTDGADTGAEAAEVIFVRLPRLSTCETLAPAAREPHSGACFQIGGLAGLREGRAASRAGWAAIGADPPHEAHTFRFHDKNRSSAKGCAWQ